MIEWKQTNEDIVGNELTEMINGKLNNLDIVIGVTSNHTYFINVVDLNNKATLFNGNTDSLTAILSTLEQFK